MLARTRPWAALLGGGVLTYFLLLNGPAATPKISKAVTSY
jgi:hypothetical protein